MAEMLSKIKNFREKHPVVSTVAETVAVNLGNKALIALGNRAGLNLGHGRRDMKMRNDFLEKHPVASAVLQVGVAPVLEELAFRKFPADKLAISEMEPGKRRRTNILMNLAFAAMHAGKNTGRDGLPVAQFIAGENLSRIYQKRGYKHAVLSHALNNGINTGIRAIKRRRARSR